MSRPQARMIELVGGPADGMNFVAGPEVAAIVMVATTDGRLVPEQDGMTPEGGTRYRYEPCGPRDRFRFVRIEPSPGGPR